MSPSATIVRDDWGVPHIQAATTPEAFYAMGYAQAQDALELMLRQYLGVRGERASIPGSEPGAFAQAAVGGDMLARMWQHHQRHLDGFERLPAAMQDAYLAFIDGVQRYMADHPEEVPEWAPVIDPGVVLGINGSHLWGYAILGAIGTAVRAGIELDLTSWIAPRQLVQTGGLSNEWVLAPWRTADGATAVLSDPHSSFEGLPLWEVVLRTGDGLHSTGGCIVGSPIPLLGHNAHVAWAETTGVPLVSDLYAVETLPGEPHAYLFDGQRREMTIEQIEIEVAGGDPVRQMAAFTDHNGLRNPVVGRSGDTAYALCTSYVDAAHLLDECFWNWHHATDIEQFVDAMRTDGMYTQNIMAGDRHGSTFYVCAGRVPIRAEGVDPYAPVPGNSSQTAWQGIHDLDDLVQIADPDAGYMQNCNIAPDTMIADTAGTTLEASRYPAYIFNDTPGRTNTRGRRAVDLLSRQFAATTQDLLGIALDDHWLDTERWQDALRHACDDHLDRVTEAGGVDHGLLRQLLGFDGRAAPESTEALAFFHWRAAFARGIEVAPERQRDIVGAIKRGERLEAGDSATLLDAVQAARETMLRAHGTTHLAYGEAFRIGRTAPGVDADTWSWPARGTALIDRQPLEGEAAIHEATTLPLRMFLTGEPDASGRRTVLLGGKICRLVIFTDPIQSYSAFLPGQAHRPDSPHFADQSRLVGEQRLKSTHFDGSTLPAHTVSTLSLDVPDRA